MPTTDSQFSLRRASVILAAAVACLATAIVAPSAAQQPGGPPPPVTVSQPLQQRTTDWEEFTGQFAALEYVEVRARVSGYLTEIHFTDGQMVNKGDLLFVIDPRQYEIALTSATARMEEAKASLELANRQLLRAGELRQKDFVAQSTYDERTQQMRVATASLESAKAAVRDAELNLQFTRVVAPMAGRTSTHEVSIGNLISGGSGANPTRLTRIVSLDPIHFNFDMSESDYLTHQRAVASGKLASSREHRVPVQLRLADETGWPHRGHLDFIDNQVDRSSGTIRARALVPNPGNLITPGQFGRLRLPSSEPYDALLIPDAAVTTDQSRKIVMVVAEDGTVAAKTIKPGALVNGLRVVREGLLPTDKVVINGLLRARPGGKVTPQPGTIEPVAAGAEKEGV